MKNPRKGHSHHSQGTRYGYSGIKGHHIYGTSMKTEVTNAKKLQHKCHIGTVNSTGIGGVGRKPSGHTTLQQRHVNIESTSRTLKQL